jgi:hypothetical protein
VEYLYVDLGTTTCTTCCAEEILRQDGGREALGLCSGTGKPVTLTSFVRHGFGLDSVVETSLVRGSAHGAKPRFYALATWKSTPLNLSG